LPNTVTIKGFKEYSDKLNKLSTQFPEQLDDIAEIAAQQWEQLAKRDVPVDQGFLKSGISHKQEALNKWEIVSSKEYSPYMEWGTKSRVNVPAELQSYAAQFRGGSPGAKVKGLIYEWVLRKGIPKEAQWPIFISIMRNGVKPHPFFFIQRPIVEKQLMNDLKQLIETLD
jgi:hypothetical protein